MIFLMIISNIQGVLNIEMSLEMWHLTYPLFGLLLATGHMGQHGNAFFFFFFNLTLFDA